jgi:hypothetical protein
MDLNNPNVLPLESTKFQDLAMSLNLSNSLTEKERLDMINITLFPPKTDAEKTQAKTLFETIYAAWKSRAVFPVKPNPDMMLMKQVFQDLGLPASSLNPEKK